MAIKEDILNEKGIFIQSRTCPLLGKPYTQDYVVVNGKEYTTWYASYTYKQVVIMDGENSIELDVCLARQNGA